MSDPGTPTRRTETRQDGEALGGGVAADRGAAGDKPWSRWLNVTLPEISEERTDLPARIASVVWGFIESNGLSVGERLPSERELARILGVSRLSVREAVRSLATQGIVTVRRGAGVFVDRDTSIVAAVGADSPRPVSRRLFSLEDVFEVRGLLEPAAAERAARRADPSDVRLLTELAARFSTAAAVSPPAVQLLADADVALHLEIAHCADNQLLASEIESLHISARRAVEVNLRSAVRVDRVAQEHQSLLRAIQARDARAAYRAMVAHLRSDAAGAMAAGRAESLSAD